MSKRFEYRRTSQSIIDNTSGYIYQGDKKTCDLLNQVNDRADRNAELLEPFLLLMAKYEISSVDKLDKMLMEQKVW